MRITAMNRDINTDTQVDYSEQPHHGPFGADPSPSFVDWKPSMSAPTLAPSVGPTSFCASTLPGVSTASGAAPGGRRSSFATVPIERISVAAPVGETLSEADCGVELDELIAESDGKNPLDAFAIESGTGPPIGGER